MGRTLPAPSLGDSTDIASSSAVSANGSCPRRMKSRLGSNRYPLWRINASPNGRLARYGWELFAPSQGASGRTCPTAESPRETWPGVTICQPRSVWDFPRTGSERISMASSRKGEAAIAGRIRVTGQVIWMICVRLISGLDPAARNTQMATGCAFGSPFHRNQILTSHRMRVAAVSPAPVRRLWPHTDGVPVCAGPRRPRVIPGGTLVLSSGHWRGIGSPKDVALDSTGASGVS